MRTAACLALALLAQPAMAQPALAVPVQYHCAGTAEGANGERVEVIHYFAAGGQHEGQSANWDPPRRVEPGPDNPPDLSFTLFFGQPTAQGPGTGSGASLTAMAFAPPGSRNAGAVQRRLDGAWAEFSANGGAPGCLPLERDARIADLPMTAMRMAALEPLPEAARDLAVRLHDRRGKLLAAARFDLSDPARRDALYREAWARAEREGADPAKCPAAEE